MLRSAPARRLFCSILVLAGFLWTEARPASEPLPEARWDALPKWRGFNLLGKFHLDWNNEAYREQDFQLISEWGFNFVRLPIDYRTYTKAGDWLSFDEAILEEIDQAVAWGEQYGVHVQLNLHRIPGYTVASPEEPTSLWADAYTQSVAAAHWGLFARRYRGVPSSQLSFNLLNEPAGGVTPEEYAVVVALLAEAIRSEDPDRLIVADGMGWGREPVGLLVPLEVAQATRGYSPFNLSHYRASWVDGSDSMAAPVWPGNQVSRFLYGSAKPGEQTAMIIEGPFENAVQLRLRVDMVSDCSRLIIQADGEVILDTTLDAQAADDGWKRKQFTEEWGIYQSTLDGDLVAEVPAGTRDLIIFNLEGDWMTVDGIGVIPVEPDAMEAVFVPSIGDHGTRQTVSVTWDGVTLTAPEEGAAQLWADTIEPWVEFRDFTGTGVMVGEFGAHNRTPHEVVLAWLGDLLEMYEMAGLPWAIWNFRGSFGPIDSDRSDVNYEELDGLLVDREMLDLLRQFTGYRENYQAWARRVFPPDADPAGITRQGDFNGDGVTNFWCYAMGADPTLPTGGVAPRVTIGTGTGTRSVHFLRSLRAVGVEIRLDRSTDGITWEPVDPEFLESRGAIGDAELIEATIDSEYPDETRFRLALVERFLRPE